MTEEQAFAAGAEAMRKAIVKHVKAMSKKAKSYRSTLPLDQALRALAGDIVDMPVPGKETKQ